jgi:hypothetical protein
MCQSPNLRNLVGCGCDKPRASGQIYQLVRRSKFMLACKNSCTTTGTQLYAGEMARRTQKAPDIARQGEKLPIGSFTCKDKVHYPLHARTAVLFGPGPAPAQLYLDRLMLAACTTVAPAAPCAPLTPHHSLNMYSRMDKSEHVVFLILSHQDGLIGA